MQDRPDLAELIDSVQHFLQAEVLPACADARLKFRTRVAANVLSIASREIAAGAVLLERELARLKGLPGLPSPPPGREETDLHEVLRSWSLQLARGLRAGTVEALPGTPLWDSLRRTAIEKLEVANPAYLRKVSGAS